MPQAQNIDDIGKVIEVIVIVIENLLKNFIVKRKGVDRATMTFANCTAITTENSSNSKLQELNSAAKAVLKLPSDVNA